MAILFEASIEDTHEFMTNLKNSTEIGYLDMLDAENFCKRFSSILFHEDSEYADRAKDAIDCIIIVFKQLGEFRFANYLYMQYIPLSLQ